MSESREGQKKIAIVGFAESWKEAPFGDPSVKIFGLNELHKYLPRWDYWIEVHDGETLGVTKRDLSEGEQKRHLEWLSLNHGDKPIFMQPQYCDGRFPNAVPFPLEKLIDTFGPYFTSSIGYMIGWAVLEGFNWIGLYGIDLASDVEYPHQRPNAEYLIGWARGLGITVEVSKGSAILKASHLYGYEKPLENDKIMTAILGHRKKLNDMRDQKIAELNTLDGAIQENENFTKLYEYTNRGVQITSY